MCHVHQDECKKVRNTNLLDVKIAKGSMVTKILLTASYRGC